jgi:hypothetical protein
VVLLEIAYFWFQTETLEIDRNRQINPRLASVVQHTSVSYLFTPSPSSVGLCCMLQLFAVYQCIYLYASSMHKV